MKISTYVEAKTGVIYLSVVWNRSNRFMVSTGLHSEKKFYGTEVPGSCAKSRRLQVILDRYSGSEKEHLMNIIPQFGITLPQFGITFSFEKCHYVIK